MVGFMFKVNAFISGRVQGVGFRYFTQKMATKLNTMGYVRNLVDGRVEVVAYGTKEELNIFIDNLREGSTFGIVNDIQMQFTEVNESPFKSFLIKY